MTPTGYKFTVTHEGTHLFTTEPQNLTDAKVKILYLDLKEAFPVEEGFKITCVYWKQYGEPKSF